MSEAIAKFFEVAVPVDTVLNRLKDREDALSRWAVLVGTPGEPLFEHMAQAMLDLVKRPRLTLVFAPTGQRFLHEVPEAREWIEHHMVSATPAILLIRKAEQEAMIVGAVSQRVLDDAVEKLCSERPGDRLQERLEELTANGGTLALPKATEYVQVGVTESGQPLYVRQTDPGVKMPSEWPPDAERAVELGMELPQHRTEAGWPRCGTCDGGGCPDCTDPA